MKRYRSNSFRTPPVSCEHGLLIEAMTLCREKVADLRREWGERHPMRRDAEAVLRMMSMRWRSSCRTMRRVGSEQTGNSNLPADRKAPTFLIGGGGVGSF